MLNPRPNGSPPESENPDVFISHAGSEKSRLEPYLQKLTEAGLTIWIDEPPEYLPNSALSQDARLLASDQLDDGIRKGLRNSHCVVIFWTKKSTERHRDWIRLEAGYAKVENKLFPVKLDDIEDELISDALKNRNGVRFVGEELNLSDEQKAQHQKFRNFVLDVKSFVEEKSGSSESVVQGNVRNILDAQEAPVPEILYCTVDRTPQKLEVKNLIETELDKNLKDPLVFVLKGHIDQVHEAFMTVYHKLLLTDVMVAGMPHGSTMLKPQIPIQPTWPSNITSVQDIAESTLKKIKHWERVKKETETRHSIFDWVRAILPGFRDQDRSNRANTQSKDSNAMEELAKSLHEMNALVTCRFDFYGATWREEDCQHLENWIEKWNRMLGGTSNVLPILFLCFHFYDKELAKGRVRENTSGNEVIMHEALLNMGTRFSNDPGVCFLQRLSSIPHPDADTWAREISDLSERGLGVFANKRIERLTLEEQVRKIYPRGDEAYTMRSIMPKLESALSASVHNIEN